MTASPQYRLAFLGSFLIHLLFFGFLFYEHQDKTPSMAMDGLRLEAKPLPSAEASPKEEIIQAVHVDASEVAHMMNRIKSQRQSAQRAEFLRQKQLTQMAEAAKQKRIQEEKRLEKIKQEAQVAAAMQERKRLEEQAKIKELALEKAAEEKQLADLKEAQKNLEKLQIAENLKKEEAARVMAKLEEEKRKAEFERKRAAEQAEALKNKEELAKKQESEAQLAALKAENQARILSEIDKFKSLIISAIGQQWIVPEEANRHLSSQFNIRLAPTGAVLDVRLVRSSGDPVLDRSAQSAIYKASPLPVPVNPDAFNVFREISLTVRPESARG